MQSVRYKKDVIWNNRNFSLYYGAASAYVAGLGTVGTILSANLLNALGFVAITAAGAFTSLLSLHDYKTGKEPEQEIREEVTIIEEEPETEISEDEEIKEEPEQEIREEVTIVEEKLVTEEKPEIEEIREENKNIDQI